MRAEHGGETVGDQRLLHARQVAVLVQQLRHLCVTPISVPALSNTSMNREGEHHDHEGCPRTGARSPSLQDRVGDERRRQPTRCRNNWDDAERTRPISGDDEDADQRAAEDAAGVEGNDEHEPKQAKNRRPRLQAAQGHQRGRMGDHDAGLLQRDDAEEQADAGRDGEFQVLRNGIDDVFADAGRSRSERRSGRPSRTRRRAPAAR